MTDVQGNFTGEGENHTYVVLHDNIESIEQAKSLREVTGDLVVNSNNQIVEDPMWLWDFEASNPDSYSMKKIESRYSVPLNFTQNAKVRWSPPK